MSKYRKQFLDLALETGILAKQEGRQSLHLDPFFQGNAHAANLAARACQEIMGSSSRLELHEARSLVAFDDPSYPLLALSAQSFRGGDCRHFVHYTTYHRYERYGHGKPTDEKFIIVGTTEDCVQLSGAIAFINQHLGVCVGAVILYSPTFIQAQNSNFPVPITRVITEEEAANYLGANTKSGPFFPPRRRESALE